LPFFINPLPESPDARSSNILRRINPEYITVQDSLQPLQIKPTLPLAVRMIPAWINNLHPQLVLFSVAADDRDGRSDRETIDALEGYSPLRNDQHGWIQIVTDGNQMWMEFEK